MTSPKEPGGVQGTSGWTRNSCVAFCLQTTGRQYVCPLTACWRALPLADRLSTRYLKGRTNDCFLYLRPTRVIKKLVTNKMGFGWSKMIFLKKTFMKRRDGPTMVFFLAFCLSIIFPSNNSKGSIRSLFLTYIKPWENLSQRNFSYNR